MREKKRGSGTKLDAQLEVRQVKRAQSALPQSETCVYIFLLFVMARVSRQGTNQRIPVPQIGPPPQALSKSPQALVSSAIQKGPCGSTPTFLTRFGEKCQDGIKLRHKDLHSNASRFLSLNE